MSDRSVAGGLAGGAAPAGTSPALRVFAPAKVNFGLRVTGRRADGYHELDSLFLPLDFGDEIELDCARPPGAGIELTLDPPLPELPPGGENLAVRAASAFCAAAGFEPSLGLRLRKRIPLAAGLGGGSSDAAAVLRGLDRIHPGRVEPARLASIALSLGADVPFFLDPAPARVRGIGERREALAAPFPRWNLLLVNPGLPLATARVFAAHAAAGPRPAAAADLGACLEAIRREPLAPGVLQRLLVNDLEPAATRLCPQIGPLRERIAAAGALAVGLSGSGATLFGVFADAQSARRAGAAFGAGPWTRVARTAEAR